MHTTPTADDVRRAYEVMLGRPPESDQAIAGQLAAATSTGDLVRNIAASAEFCARVGIDPSSSSPFAHYNACIDVPGIIRSHAKATRVPVPGHYVNFLGVVIPTKVMSFLADRGGELDPIPIPANYHADMAEWAGALRAVDLARRSFTMIELGCGWGCWMSNTGVAARARGLAPKLIGIEGDPTHIEYAHETLLTNGFRPDQFKVHAGIAAAEAGYALFPKRVNGAEHWGFQPIFGASEQQSLDAVASGNYERQVNVPLRAVIGDVPRIDLLHMDIQGGEVNLVRQCLELLGERVAYIVIGTHSRQIEGQLMDILQPAGWGLEIERPAIYKLVDGVPHLTVDGVQAWRNPRHK